MNLELLTYATYSIEDDFDLHGRVRFSFSSGKSSIQELGFCLAEEVEQLFDCETFAAQNFCVPLETEQLWDCMYLRINLHQEFFNVERA